MVFSLVKLLKLLVLPILMFCGLSCYDITVYLAMVTCFLTVLPYSSPRQLQFRLDINKILQGVIFDGRNFRSICIILHAYLQFNFYCWSTFYRDLCIVQQGKAFMVWYKKYKIYGSFAHQKFTPIYSTYCTPYKSYVVLTVIWLQHQGILPKRILLTNGIHKFIGNCHRHSLM